MTTHEISARILLADDDEDDRKLFCDAFAKAQIQAELHTVKDGEEALRYLRRQGIYADQAPSAHAELILLDLNMPVKDGRETLRELKSDPRLKLIPVIVFTTSDSENDVEYVYRLGANSFVTKPRSFRSLVEFISTLNHYWLETARLPLPL